MTQSQYDQVLVRLTTLELAMNDILVSLRRLVSVGDVNAITTILQNDIASISLRVDAVEASVTALEEEPIR